MNNFLKIKEFTRNCNTVTGTPSGVLEESLGDSQHTGVSWWPYNLRKDALGT